MGFYYSQVEVDVEDWCYAFVEGGSMCVKTVYSSFTKAPKNKVVSRRTHLRGCLLPTTMRGSPQSLIGRERVQEFVILFSYLFPEILHIYMTQGTGAKRVAK